MASKEALSVNNAVRPWGGSPDVEFGTWQRKRSFEAATTHIRSNGADIVLKMTDGGYVPPPTLEAIPQVCFSEDYFMHPDPHNVRGRVVEMSPLGTNLFIHVVGLWVKYGGYESDMKTYRESTELSRSLCFADVLHEFNPFFRQLPKDDLNIVYDLFSLSTNGGGPSALKDSLP